MRKVNCFEKISPTQLQSSRQSFLISEKNTKIIELASAPYGLDFDLARKYGVDVIKAFGLPGKYTPKTAGEIIGKKIQQHLQKEE